MVTGGIENGRRCAYIQIQHYENTNVLLNQYHSIVEWRGRGWQNQHTLYGLNKLYTYIVYLYGRTNGEKAGDWLHLVTLTNA